MKYRAIIFISLFLTGCQGLQFVEQTASSETDPLHLDDPLFESLGHHCVIPTTPIQAVEAKEKTVATAQDMLPRRPNDLWEILSQSFQLPVPDDKRVRYYKRWYLDNPHHLDTVTKRAEPFLYYIYQQVDQRNMPLELVLLPFVESAFNPKAYSHRGAAGLWQITIPTGKTFGLEYLKGYDGRRDIVTSTTAALDLLEYLHDKFKGDWLHAIAAYNTGEGRVRRAIKRNRAQQKSTDFWALKLPKETRLYVPKLLAMADLIKQRHQHNLPLLEIHPQPVLTEVVVRNRVTLELIARHAGLDSQAVYALNPGYLSGHTHANRDNKILLPHHTRQTFYNNRLSGEYVKQKFIIHDIQPGDSLSELAESNNTTVARIMNANDLTGSMIFAGQQLLIPHY
ncbi:transglycosylase SLT domain-containing protein [Photobacterium atrarenae]|uniref:Transglycosylase SLT domain-containing protein n=1 Tax=Photobacterium atrarenae TaxID=865757 RepID=A0ABY5GIK7_9GAMM|nr:transglycosylase SLT domain-containing protein [Photobacterium atrarenae]UTV29089.1 transglycosylase SLT domain-containing protein [Photobacterium atrarenae]